MSAIVAALTQCELEENDNLVEILGLVRSSRKSQSDAKLASVVRGLCTKNLALLATLRRCESELDLDDKDVFKSLVNDFIVWFEDAFVVFERYFSCFPLHEDYDYAKFSRPVLHIGCYSAFIDLAIATLRNPFIVEKLTTFRFQITSLLARYSEHLKLRNLNKISFDNVQAFGGNKVSCSFTLDEIAERTQNAPLFVGNARVEMLLLNLKHNSGAPRSPGTNFNAFAVLQRHGDEDPRSLMYPPFRLNEVAIDLSEQGLTLQAIAFFSKASQDTITITGSVETLKAWNAKLCKIFPQINNKLKPSKKLELVGLGISCLSSEDDESDKSPVEESVASFTPPSEAISEGHGSSSRRLSLEIMKKTLGNTGATSTVGVTKKTNVIDSEIGPGSAKAEYCYEDDAESVISSDEEGIEASFEIVKPKLKPISPPKATVYGNAAGSAINIHEFGKDYNPSFLSVNETGAQRLKPKKNFLLNIFRKNKSRETLATNLPLQTDESAPKKTPDDNSKPRKKKSGKSSKEHAKPKQKSSRKFEGSIKEKSQSEETKQQQQKTTGEPKSKMAPPPPLDLSNIASGPSSAASTDPPSSASSTFKRTLPSPFALPSSTSQYFFKPPSATPSTNESSSSLASNNVERSLCIPDALKETINSESTIDFYISPTSPKALKVSKWKRKYAKWEMLTTNENLFIKIVTNYELNKSWLLTFKEEYDAEYEEVIDKPLLILDLDPNTQVRKSSALDLEINAINSINGEKMSIIMRCLNGNLMNELSNNLGNIVEMMQSKPSGGRNPSSSESSSTLMSSLMSKPSISSTMTSLRLEDSRENSWSPASLQERQQPQEPSSNMLLLDRLTVRLHKQMESYEKIHELSSWKTISMYTLSVCHSAGSVDNGMYHLIMEKQEENDSGAQQISWAFDEGTIRQHMEKIGRAGLLVKTDSDIYMIECKCKKELRRLQGLF